MGASAEELLKLIMDQIRSIATIKTIIGDPVTVADSTIIPVCKIMVGFGGGGGGGERSKDKDHSGGGAGGGGGVRIEPVAFIVIKGEKVSLLSTRPGRLDAVFDTFPRLLEKLKELKERKKEKAAEEKKTEEEAKK